MICKSKNSNFKLFEGYSELLLPLEAHIIDTENGVCKTLSAESSCSFSILLFHLFCEFSFPLFTEKYPTHIVTPFFPERVVSHSSSTGKWPQHQTCQQLRDHLALDTWLSFRWFCKGQAVGLIILMSPTQLEIF